MNVSKRCIAWMLALAGCASLIQPSMPILAADDSTQWIGSEDLTDSGTAAPAADDVVPDANQFRYQKDELAAFCHFGPNTFNEIEWGEHYGSQTPAQIFRLNTDFDADGYVKTLKDAGFKKLIVTAKHHDGFCIWNSKWTDYTCAAAGYKNGEGDVLAEISAACTKYDLDMGLYLSPWDIHDDSYGYKDADGNALDEAHRDQDAKDYNVYYNNTLEEILSADKYGNDGHFVEVWMDGAKGSGANAQEYDFATWFNTIQKYEGKAAGYDADCMLFGAESYTTVRWIGNELGYAHENTWSKVTVNRENNTLNDNRPGSYSIGWENGNQWAVPEADARITSGWFWGNNKKTPKTLTDLAGMYFGSVGHGATFLLNIPPNNQGALDTAIEERALEFGEAIRNSFAHNLVQDESTALQADQVRGSDLAFSPDKLADDDDLSVWSTNDGTSTGSILVDFGGTKTLDCVSIEEAIQYGQRINSYSVEYLSANGEWKALASGETIGPKRLIRTSPFRASKLKITVSTPSGKTPVLSEIGAYKLDEAFELSSGAPEGMTITDVNDSSIATTGTWTSESGSQFINGTNKWANAGATMTWTFTGTKAYILGTLDPNHGTADIEIDGTVVATIDMHSSTRSLGQTLFESDTLAEGTHTLKVTTKTSATGIEAFYSISNHNKGMVGIEQKRYTMNENETMDVKLIRTGGTAPVTVTFSPNPGTAIQDDFNTELIHTVTFAEGETEKTVTVQTRRNTNQTGNLQFSVELSTADPDLILGFNSAASIEIQDFESTLQDYSQDNPYIFPDTMGESTTLYAALGTVYDNELASDGQWNMRKEDADWGEIGRVINCFQQGDTLTIPYRAAKAGTYDVTVYYRSGSNTNKLVWAENSNKITAGEVSAGAADSSVTRTAAFTFTVASPGAGTLVFTGPETKSPLIDRFVITPHELIDVTHTLSVTADEHGTATPFGVSEVSEGDVSITLEPEDGYEVAQVLVNGSPVTITNPLIISVTEDTEVSITHAFAHYTAANPFVFPTAGQSKTLEAEHSILTNTGTNEDWPLQISSNAWASEGKFVNACNSGDYIEIPYTASQIGDYTFTLTFRSGDARNSLSWSEASGKIEDGSVTAGASDSAGATHTASFTLTVTAPGAGVLKITAGSYNAPQMDCFEITAPDSPISLYTDLLQAVIRDVEGSQDTFKDDPTAQTLSTKLQEAKDVLTNAQTQQEIDDAAKALNAAWLNVRLIPSQDGLASLPEAD